ncbi:MAG: Hsp20/alpha crystallin family protein [Candidatus Saccharibacteria bacterium]
MPHETTRHTMTAQSDPTITPRVDVLETENDVIYLFELPGADPDEIDLEIGIGELYLSAPLLEKTYKGQINYLYRERQPGRYFRVLVPPNNADSNTIKADYENGLLEVKFPKKTAAATNKRTRKQVAARTE